jgi:hypothetical protein
MKTFRKRAFALSLALAFSGIALADDEAGKTQFSGFADFVGSESNLDSLVSGMRHDTPITLTSAAGTPGGPSSVTFDPPTKPMGFGNVRLALTLARAELQAQGISEPTPQQIDAALMGGTVTTADGKTVALKGVLQLRSQGMGWGQIRRTLNLPPTTFSMSSRGGTGITTALGPPRAGGADSRGRGIERGERGVSAKSAVAVAPLSGHLSIVTAAGTPVGSSVNTNLGRDNGSGRGLR